MKRARSPLLDKEPGLIGSTFEMPLKKAKVLPTLLRPIRVTSFVTAKEYSSFRAFSDANAAVPLPSLPRSIGSGDPLGPERAELRLICSLMRTSRWAPTSGGTGTSSRSALLSMIIDEISAPSPNYFGFSTGTQCVSSAREQASSSTRK